MASKEDNKKPLVNRRAIIGWGLGVALAITLSLVGAGVIKLVWDWLLRPTFNLPPLEFWRTVVGTFAVYAGFLVVRIMRAVVAAWSIMLQMGMTQRHFAKKGFPDLMRHFRDDENE